MPNTLHYAHVAATRRLRAKRLMRTSTHPALDGTFLERIAFYAHLHCCNELEVDMGFGRGVLLWLIGVPIPIILLIALFWHH